VNLASRLEHEAPPGGVLISFETYALVKDKIRCEERGHVQVKGIAQPVATYAVVGLNEDPEQVGTEHLRLELEINRMSGDERKLAADALRRALGCLKKVTKASLQRQCGLAPVDSKCPLLKALGIQIPGRLLSFVDEVIE
jgi:hypothetical protein